MDPSSSCQELLSALSFLGLAAMSAAASAHPASAGARGDPGGTMRVGLEEAQRQWLEDARQNVKRQAALMRKSLVSRARVGWG